ncbi:MAG TPA: alpha/beta family hydrolase, partial [Terriglobales bacterium]|nr:alpha/beta family hydrolase [Terriglobales bacterium]
DCVGMFEQFAVSADPPVDGFLHPAQSDSSDGLVLTHGAGGNAQMPLLVAVAEAFAGARLTVLRCNFPFRQKRSFGPPHPADAARDRLGLKNAIAALRGVDGVKRLFVGGQSYGGRQASMLLAEESAAAALLLLSYPLHPPGKPDQPRTQHLPLIKVPVMFVHGTHDPFGTIEEIESARKLIPAETLLIPVEGAGHDLGFMGKAKREALPSEVVREFKRLLG